MKKLRLELDTMRVESFATAGAVAGMPCGTLRGHEAAVTQDCPTNFCATVPLLCKTVFAPQCTGTTCTG
jgi:hypothetical protein